MEISDDLKFKKKQQLNFAKILLLLNYYYFCLVLVTNFDYVGKFIIILMNVINIQHYRRRETKINRSKIDDLKFQHLKKIRINSKR